MNLRNLFIIFISLLLAGGGILFLNKNKQQESLQTGKMKLTSSTFTNNQMIPSKYTCDGANINPPLSISDIPANAKSLALIMDDPDSPMGTWIHWTVWNIAPDTKEIGEKTVPAGAVEGKTSFGKPGYGGPCPPSGTHHYYFKLYALDIPLPVFVKAPTKSDIENTITSHIINEAELVGLYSRK